MSASEKLKALDGQMDADWKRVSPGAPLIEGPFANVQALCDLRNALPQIVAVVEAAQGWYEIGEDEYLLLPKFAQQHYEPIHEDETPTLERCFRLAALAALDNALERTDFEWKEQEC